MEARTASRWVCADDASATDDMISIGDWFGVLETLSLLAVITNALLTSFVNSTTAKIDPTIDVLQYPQQNQRWSVSRLW